MSVASDGTGLRPDKIFTARTCGDSGRHGEPSGEGGRYT